MDTTARFAQPATGTACTEFGLAALPPELLAEPRDTYVRHLAYADPQGAYSVVYLIWWPGQYSPVHGHRTWCTYRVLRGTLAEEHFRWDADAQAALPCGRIARREGDVVAAPPGLGQIHRLGNDGSAGPAPAVSLHVYGVARDAIATGVNHVVRVRND
jgi:predicted metal-dependent enzyme (double-stranded beta helix superfamily)